jgi:hypothetical protein
MKRQFNITITIALMVIPLFALAGSRKENEPERKGIESINRITAEAHIGFPGIRQSGRT